MTILKALERMGYKGRMTGHGFGGVASTILHEQGYNHEHIEAQLAHGPQGARTSSAKRVNYKWSFISITASLLPGTAWRIQEPGAAQERAGR